VPTRLLSVVFDAADPAGLGRFWAAALGWEVVLDEPDEVVVAADSAAVWDDGVPPYLTFVPVPDPKAGKNRVHLDLVSASVDQQHETAQRLLELGAGRADIGQRDAPWIVLHDPEGNELCVLEPRDDYRGVRDVAAVVIDCADPRALADFWSAASGWPVASADTKLASLRHPSAPATALELLAVPDPKQRKNRLHIDVAPLPDDDLGAEVARLEDAGGRRIDIGQGEVPWVVLADPEGNELCVLTPR
jgi:predicted enzyme related to lactoylglutathione lyase